MKGFSVLVWILAAEVLTVFVLLIWIVIHRMIIYIIQSVTRKRKEKISEHLLHLLKTHTPFSLSNYPVGKGWKKSLLEAIELFGRRVKGDEWDALRKEIATPLLIEKARKCSSSFFWTRRNFAARVFAISPFPEDEEAILRLMDDPVFLVKSQASLAAIFLESKKGIEKALLGISGEHGFAKFFYRDALLQSSQKAISIVIELAQDPKLHLAALDLLAAKSWAVPIPFLEKDLNSKDPKELLFALKVLFRNPLADSLPYFVRYINHPVEEIRLAAMRGFELFPTEETWPLLEKTLEDPAWFVRIEAAKMLKKRGDRGVEVLKKQTAGPAFEAAQYAMKLP